MKTIAFLNNKGGVGKTTLVYHIGWMLGTLGHNVLLVDLDPQTNLTAMFLSDDQLESLFSRESQKSSNKAEDSSQPIRATIYKAIFPVLGGRPRGEAEVHIPKDNTKLGLIMGDLSLSMAEGHLSDAWVRSADANESSFRVLTAIDSVIHAAADKIKAEYVLIDLGPNLGALNRTALISTDYVITPLRLDIFSLIGLANLGPTMREWKKIWHERLEKARKKRAEDKAIDSGAWEFDLPENGANHLGYIVNLYKVREGRPTQAFQKWEKQIPFVYHREILELAPPDISGLIPDDDDKCLAQIKDFASMSPKSMDVRRPMFTLKPEDGFWGNHHDAPEKCYEAFKALALKIIEVA